MSTERVDSSEIVSSKPATAAATERAGADYVSSTVQPIKAAKDITLNNKTYEIVRQIASSGEAEVFLISDGVNQQVLKHYFSNFKPKEEVIEKLKKLGRRDVIYPVENGYNQNRFWEINEYISGGTLSDQLPVRNTERFREIVRNVVEAIHACHQQQIIHRDVKPVNVFFRNPSEIVLGDFGIASPLSEGNDYRVTTVARTTTYAAPELFTNINNLTTLDRSVDYYALGISALEMWQGKDPFEDISQFNVMRIKNEGRVFIPAEIPDSIQRLIKGLITTEPPKRWGYAEVQKWLRGEPVQVYYETKEKKFPVYEFDAAHGITVTQPKDLAYHMERNLRKAENQLYSGAILNWIKSGSEDLYGEVYDIVEKSYKSTSPENTEAGVTKAIYLFDAERPFKSYNGDLLKSAVELSAHIEQHNSYFAKELARPTAKMYLFLEARGLSDRVDKYRKYYRTLSANRAFNLVVLDLNDNKLVVDNTAFENISQLSAAPPALAPVLMKAVADPESKVSVWLDITAPQLAQNINTWRRLGDASLETLGYALGTHGFRLGNDEAATHTEFYALLKNNVSRFTTAADAPQTRAAADYWLKNYQGKSLAAFFQTYQEEEMLSPDEFVHTYEYIFKNIGGENVFQTVGQAAPTVKKVLEQDEKKRDAVLNITATALADYLNKEHGKHVFQLELVEELFMHLGRVSNVYPAFATALAHTFDNNTSVSIHHDIARLQKNSNTFAQYEARLSAFMNGGTVQAFPDLRFRQHWKNEQTLIEKKHEAIKKQAEKLRAADVKNINTKFNQYLKANIENSINYLEKGKRFFCVLAILVGGTVSFLFLQTAWAVPTAGSTFGWIGGGVAVFTLWRVRAVSGRRPHTGLGIIMDPAHQLFGRLLYRPVYLKQRNDPGSQLNVQTETARQQELQKIDSISNGKLRNDEFEESVRIRLLEEAQLQTELRKN